MLVPAYAATIHKSQGSGYSAVIIPVLTQHYAMLQRNLLYTGVTRGKRLIVLVGQKKAVAIAVRNASGRRRWSKSAEWLARKTCRNSRVKQAMAQSKAHHIWIEQCEAAQTVRARFGLKAAFDYIVGEKLLNFASAASTHPEFARESPDGSFPRLGGCLPPMRLQRTLHKLSERRSKKTLRSWTRMTLFVIFRSGHGTRAAVRTHQRIADRDHARLRHSTISRL